MNVQGLNEITKRQSIEQWALGKRSMWSWCKKQESTTHRRRRSQNTFGISAQARCSSIKNKLRKREQRAGRQPEQNGNKPWNTTESQHWWQQKLVRDIEEVEPVNGRLMKVTFDTVPRLHVINAYAPQAGRPGPAGRVTSWLTKAHAEQHFLHSDKQRGQQQSSNQRAQQVETGQESSGGAEHRTKQPQQRGEPSRSPR